MTELPPFRTGRPRVERGHVRPFEGLELAYAVMEGQRPGPCLLVSAGVHGSEYCSIETAIRLMQRRPEGLSGSLVVLPILNPGGFARRSIYLMPEDGRNLNRMFPGRPDGSFSERLAHWLTTRVYPQVDAYLDLHGGDLDESLASFTIYGAASEKSRELAIAFGAPTNIASFGNGYSVSAANDIGVPAILPEVGGNGLWGEDSVGEMLAGVERVMHHLGMIEGPVAPPAPNAAFVTMWVPTAPVSGLWYPAKKLSAPIAAGDSLGEIRDVFGRVLATIPSERSGSVVYTLTSLRVNEGEALLGVGTPLER